MKLLIRGILVATVAGSGCSGSQDWQGTESSELVARRLFLNSLEFELRGPAIAALDHASTAFEHEDSFHPSRIAMALNDAAVRISTAATGFTAESDEFEYQVGSKGRVFVQRKAGVALASDASFGAEAARREALGLVKRLGIPDDEIGETISRRLVRESRGVDDADAVRLVRGVKIIVTRAVGGVPVLGSQLILTYGIDGQLKKIIGHWPSLATDGHVLTTMSTRDQARQKIARELSTRFASDFKGRIRARTVFAPSAIDDGRIRLRIAAEVALEEDADDSGKMRIRVVDL